MTRLNETSFVAPAITSFNDMLVLAWTGTDKRLNVALSSDGGLTFPTKVTLNEMSIAAPALTVVESADESGPDRLFLAWTGLDTRLNVLSSTNGTTFTGKVTLNEFSVQGPALAPFGDGLALAWTGTDTHLNVIFSATGMTFVNKVTLNEFSFVGPALTTLGRLFLAWTGTDTRLNIISSSDGHTFLNRVTLNERSFEAPALASSEDAGEVDLAWTGTDEHLNVLFTAPFFQQKVTLAETSFLGPSITNLEGTTFIAWTGTDTHLNVAPVPRPLV